MMDSASQRVASEILEASLSDATEPVANVSRGELAEAFVALGAAIAEAEVGNFARQLDSVRSDEPGAAELRQKVAADLHKNAALIIRRGVQVASIAWRLADRDAEEAMQSSAWELRSALNEDEVPATSTPDAMSMAHRNYVLAAGDLEHAWNADDRPTELSRFAEDILSNVVVFAVAGAAMARAVE